VRLMARRGKRREEHVNHERWLITYADLITLLLVFFIIMYAMSKVDVSKFEVLSRALQLQFRQADSLLPRNQGMVGKMSPAIQEQDQSQTEQIMRHQQEQDKKEKELHDFKSKIETYIQENKLQTQISVADVPKGIAITLNDVFLFDLGRADLKPPAYDILNRLATLLPTLDAKVAIEGHTDNIPVNTGSIYRDNWGLSSERALSVLRYLTGKAGLNDKNFVAAGYADTMPKAPNDTPENRSKNRRVEITILR
jgi:chemotaxis protein MotB